MDPGCRHTKSHGQCDEGMEIQYPDIFEHSFLTAGNEVAFRVGRSTDAARSLISTFTSEPDMVYLICILDLSARSKAQDTRFDDLKARPTIKWCAGEFGVPERSFSDEIHQLRKASGED